MSWQPYVDQLVATGFVKHAVICGHDGNILAKTVGFEVSVDELKTLLDRYNYPKGMGQVQTSPVTDHRELSYFCQLKEGMKSCVPQMNR